MSRIALSLSICVLAGCTSVLGTLGSPDGTPASLEVVPRFQAGGLTAQAVLTPYASSSVDHLVVALYHRSDSGPETAVMNGGVPVEKDVASDSFSVPLRFVDLRRNTRYRIRASAYKAPGRDAADLISLATSFADVTVDLDNRPSLTSLPVFLADRTFSGQATSSISFTAGELAHSGLETVSLEAPAPTPAPRPAGTLQNFVNYDTLPYALQRTAPLQVGNRLYLLGGTTPSGETHKVLMATLSDAGMLGSFSEVSGRTLVTARSGHFATRVGNYVYVVGGFSTPKSVPLKSVERAVINADGTLGALATVSGVELNTARGLFTGYNSGTYVYAIGGKDPYLNSVERAKINADGTLGAFVTDAITLQTGRMSAGGVRVGRYFYVVGGESSGTGQLNSIERATVATDGTLGAFSVDARTLSSRRNRLGSVVLADRIYFFGGFNGGFLTTINSATINADDTFGPFAITNTCQLATGLENGVTFMATGSVYYIGGYRGSIINTVQRAPIVE